VLDRVDGGKFNLVSIALAELPPFDTSGNPINNGPFNVTFLGYRNGELAKDETLVVQPFPSLTTFSFPGFSALTEVRWSQGPGGGPGLQTHQFDNVTLRSMPEPAAVALLGVALGALFALRPRGSRMTAKTALQQSAMYC
jgi:hypothetical protein